MTVHETKPSAASEDAAEELILLDSPIEESAMPGAEDAPGVAERTGAANGAVASTESPAAFSAPGEFPVPGAAASEEITVAGDASEDAPEAALAVEEPVVSAPASEEADASGEAPVSGNPDVPEGASSPWPQEDLPVAAGGGEPPVPTEPASPPASSSPEPSAEPSSEPAAEEEPEDEKPMTLLEHLGELRKRLVRGFLAVMLGFFACYGFAQQLFYYLSLPLLKVMPADSKFIYTGVAEGFFVDLKVSFVAGLFVACPFLFYQIWAFIAPGLYDEEKRYVVPLAMFSALFFMLGGVFCYFGVFPFAFEFFMSYSTGNIVAMLSIDEYLSFALKMMLAFGLVFEMPLFSFFLSRMGIVTAQRMRAVRKYAVLAIFIIAAILTPPDVFSQLMMAVPMLVLYEISIGVAVLVGRKKTRKEEAAEKAAQENEA